MEFAPRGDQCTGAQRILCGRDTETEARTPGSNRLGMKIVMIDLQLPVPSDELAPLAPLLERRQKVGRRSQLDVDLQFPFQKMK